MPYTDATLLDAKTSVAGISANMGGTEIYTPLNHILQVHHTPHHQRKPIQATPATRGLTRQVFVLTDGQVCNAIFTSMTSGSP